MEETLVLTVEGTGQAGSNLLVFPVLPADEYNYSWITRIKVVTPANEVIEKDAEFSIPFDTESPVYLLLLPNTQKAEIPIGSQIWAAKPLDQTASKPDTE